MSDFLEDPDDNASQGMTMTLGDALAQMKRAWANERISKKLLPHCFHIVEALMKELDSINEKLAETEDKTKIPYGSQRTDVDRVQYVINSYIRTRLHKIESNAAVLIMEHTERQEQQADDLMDEREVTFAENFHKQRLALFNSTLLGQLSENIRALPVSRVGNGGRCFVRVSDQTDLPGVAIFDMTDPNNDILVDLQRGTTHLIPYISIQSHLEAGTADLL